MRTVLAFISILTTASLAGQAVPTPADDFDRFELFTRCQMLSIVVDVQGDEAGKINLTERRVRTMVESRLRAARLYNSVSHVHPALWVSIITLYDGSPAFATQVWLSKWVRDDTTGLERGAVTWQRLRLGTHGGDAGYVMQGLSERLDEFILDYLRVNEAWCS